MESNLYLMLLVFTYAITILSFILSKQIVVRFFSAISLIAVSLVGLQAMYYVGFGSMNAIPYYGSQAGDPGRKGEIEVCWMYGLFGVLQLFYTLNLFLRWGYEAILQHRKKKEMKLGVYT